MNPVDALIVRLAALRESDRNDRLTEQAIALNSALENLHIHSGSSIATAAKVLEMARDYPPAAIANVADIRGFHNIARLARKLIREELRA